MPFKLDSSEDFTFKPAVRRSPRILAKQGETPSLKKSPKGKSPKSPSLPKSSSKSSPKKSPQKSMSSKRKSPQEEIHVERNEIKRLDFPSPYSKKLQEEIQAQEPLFTRRYNDESYNVWKQIGKGATSTVYLMSSGQTGKFYALKQLKPDYVARKRRDIQNEVRVQEKLSNNKNILSLHKTFEDIFETSGNPVQTVIMIFDIMETDLYHERRKRAQSINVYKIWFRQMLKGIAYIHNQGFIHTDIKPQNILVRRTLDTRPEDYELFISDFGFVQKQSSMRKKLTGTPNYIAPEVLERKNYSELVDIWSCGCMFFFILYGKAPFVGKDVKETYQNIKARNFTTKFQDIPEYQEINGIIDQMLQLNVSGASFFGEEDVFGFTKASSKPASKRPSARELLQMKFFSI